LNNRKEFQEQQKILVVDDSTSTLALLEAILSETGANVLTADTPEKALALLKRHTFSLIFLDVVMPNIDGFTLAEEIRSQERTRYTPILFVTASSRNDETIMRSYKSGVVDILHKPIEPEIIIAKTRVFLQLDQQRQLIEDQQSTLKKAFKRLQSYAQHDQLTGLFNREQITNILVRKLKNANRLDNQIGVMFLDLDHFKLVNDSFGHDVGDLLLRNIASRLRKAVRDCDYVARLGGDEFCVILTELDSNSAAGRIAKRILKEMAEPHDLKGHEIMSNCSIGIALNDDARLSAADLLKNADAAMYQAKQKGRSQFAYFSESLEQEALMRIDLGTKLKTAIDENQLEVHYQPQYDSQGLKIMGFEALMRWSIDGTYISPVTFISIAEETGQINQLGHWILQAACMQMKKWLDADLVDSNATIAVNISNRQIQSGELKSQVTRVLSDTGLGPKNLELELTESTVMEDPERTISTFKEMNEVGIRISVDDFGTGYSSLAYLKNLPLDSLKIDRSFVNDITSGDGVKNTDDNNNQAIVRAIIGLSHNLGLTVIAEGVETLEQQTFLTDNGCDTLQGFLFSKPLTSKDMEALLRKAKQ
jgi:diguanylate cyclase (GGDEF)-like protein